MAINKQNLIKAARLLGAKHARFIALQARKQDKFESEWEVRSEAEVKKVHQKCIEKLLETGDLNSIKKDVNFRDMVFQHYFYSVAAAMGVAESELEFLKDPNVRMSAPPKVQIPKTLETLRRMWDEYQKKGKMPARQKDLAEKIKQQYLKKVADVWRKYSEPFRSGDVFNQEAAKTKFEEAAKVTQSRAKTIVNTETTNYYNETRRTIYDQSDAITHYLFLAIRDQATTKWCSEHKVDGKRGRHGLVYKKGDPLTQKETPAIHWNCRSEMVPLTPFNPRHRKLIEDEKMHRRNNVCHPLPKGWT